MMVSSAVRAAFGLENGLHLHEPRAEAAKQIFDHVIRPDTQHLIPNLRWQMTVAQVPREAHELTRVIVRDFDNRLTRGTNQEPQPVIELQAIAIRHRDRSRKIEEDLDMLIRDQADAATMTPDEIQRERAGRSRRRPITRAAMHACTMDDCVATAHINTNQYRK
jgi:hypothetical protein